MPLIMEAKSVDLSAAHRVQPSRFEFITAALSIAAHFAKKDQVGVLGAERIFDCCAQSFYSEASQRDETR